MEKAADVHLSLPQDLLNSFDQAAQERGLRRVTLMRKLIEDYLREIQAQRRNAEMLDYANELGAASAEFIRETDTHTVQRLLTETEW